MKCFYHSADLDGHCSGALIKMKYPECEMIGINYGDEFPWDSLGTAEVVFMVDFTLQPWEDMVRLASLQNIGLVWIDHHKSEVDNYKRWLQTDEGRSINGIKAVGTGACALVWNHLHTEWTGKAYVTKRVPTFVKLLAEYDVWNHEDERTLPFQYGMRLNDDTSPDNIPFWCRLFDEVEVRSIIKDGERILKYEELNNKKYISACGFETTLDGYKCIAVNKGLTNSKLFESVWDEEKYDMMLSFIWIGGQWTVILYSDKERIDCSEVAKRYGGGGHVGAAGFQCQSLPFDLKVKGVKR